MKITSNPKRMSVFFMDALIVLGGYWCAFLLRFDFNIDPENWAIMVRTAPFVLGAYLLGFKLFSLYRGIYYFSSFSDLINITKAVAFSALCSGALILFVLQGQFPRSVLILHPLLAYMGVGGLRFAIRWGKTFLNLPRFYSGPYRQVLIVGAGDLGESLLRQMLKTPELRYRVVGFVDDDAAKWGLNIHGYPVLGALKLIPNLLKRYHIDEIVIAITSQRGDIARSVVDVLQGLRRRPDLKIAPSLEEMLSPAGPSLALRRVRPADLLNRSVAKLDSAKISRFLDGKTILVTGSGGTIGAELCRQVAQYSPAKILLMEINATGLFYAESDLKKKCSAEIVPILGSIRDQKLLEQVFSRHKPQVVLHAAAHKHVHQLEFNVGEGVGNNVLGTYYVAAAAQRHQAEAFVLVSTDKAVRPSSIMGATKRAAELVVHSLALKKGKTRFNSVRFGNVLGSSGSVLNIFQEQISRGGPLTVTHPEARRFFMTVEEAVQLILQAAAMARGGEIFVLKMGTPVRIMDMARNLVTLSGFELGKDMDIEITGLKQGEKIEEELLEDSSGYAGSEHPDIMILRSENLGLAEFASSMRQLEELCAGGASDKLVRRLRELIPTFTPHASHETPSSR
ncbi:MAG: polysaccharide biosynthesis protein [Elusimicrobia bacterium]|nr:polysaccharide biosynthesis protein [Elusimicrobiota bacterium]